MENLQKVESKYKHDLQQRKTVSFHRGKDNLNSREITLWIVDGMKKTKFAWTKRYSQRKVTESTPNESLQSELKSYLS